MEVRYDTGHAWINVECELRNFVKRPWTLFQAATWRPYVGRKEWAFFAADDPLPFLKAVSGTGRWLKRGVLKRLPHPSAAPLPLKSR
jgi:hypothetical protein